MDAVMFLQERYRLCLSMKAGCEGCPLHGYCGVPVAEMSNAYIEREVQIVEEWVNKHPRKTRLQDFLEKYPDAHLGYSGKPNFGPIFLGYCEKGADCKGCQHYSTGLTCWDLPLEE